ncbi:MAG: GntR family transcriptional regulator, partial [Ilumatobacteraceae bacterium]
MTSDPIVYGPEADRFRRRGGLADEVAAYVRGLILTGSLKPGTKIDQDAICEALGVSRSPVREAIVILGQEGLLDVTPRRGASVAQLTPDDIVDHYALVGAVAGRAAAMAEAHGVPVVATGDVRCARAEDRRLLDALICLRERRTLDTIGRHLPPNGEGHLHSREEIVRRFRDHPEWILATRAIAERCEFGLEKLDYRFPEYPLRPGETQM